MVEATPLGGPDGLSPAGSARRVVLVLGALAAVLLAVVAGFRAGSGAAAPAAAPTVTVTADAPTPYEYRIADPADVTTLLPGSWRVGSEATPGTWFGSTRGHDVCRVTQTARDGSVIQDLEFGPASEQFYVHVAHAKGSTLAFGRACGPLSLLSG